MWFHIPDLDGRQRDSCRGEPYTGRTRASDADATGFHARIVLGNRAYRNGDGADEECISRDRALVILGGLLFCDGFFLGGICRALLAMQPMVFRHFH